MFEIYLKSGFTGERYGLMFINGKAETEDGYLAGRLKAKGIEVCAAAPPEAEPPDQNKAKRGKEK